LGDQRTHGFTHSAATDPEFCGEACFIGQLLTHAPIASRDLSPNGLFRSIGKAFS
jgi:hypothetical protein